MKVENILDAIGTINDEAVQDARIYKRARSNSAVKWSAMVACLCLVLTAAMVSLPSILKGPGGVVPPPNPDTPVPVISSEEEPSNENPPKTEHPNWQTIEEICGAENQDGSAVLALYVPTYVVYQGAVYGAVGESWVDQTGQTGVTFFNSDSTMLDTGTLEEIRFAVTTENVILIYSPKAWRTPNEYTIYLVENHMDCIALLINGYFTIYQKKFDITFELDGVTYKIVYEVVYSDHCTLGETLLSNENFTVYEAILYLDEPNEHTVYVVDLLPKLGADGYISYLDDEVDAWWVAEPVEPLVQENPDSQQR